MGGELRVCIFLMRKWVGDPLLTNRRGILAIGSYSEERPPIQHIPEIKLFLSIYLGIFEGSRKFQKLGTVSHLAIRDSSAGSIPARRASSRTPSSQSP